MPYWLHPSYWWTLLRFKMRAAFCWWLGHRECISWSWAEVTIIGDGKLTAEQEKYYKEMERSRTRARCWWCNKFLWEKEGFV